MIPLPLGRVSDVSLFHLFGVPCIRCLSKTEQTAGILISALEGGASGPHTNEAHMGECVRWRVFAGSKDASVLSPMGLVFKIGRVSEASILRL